MSQCRISILYIIYTCLTPQRWRIHHGDITCCFTPLFFLQSYGLVTWHCSFLEHLGKQAAVTINLQLPTVVIENFPSFQQLKVVHTFTLLKCVRSHGEWQTIPYMVIPTIPVGEVESEGAGDTLAIVVDVHHHATKLVAFWRCKRPIRNDSRVNLDIFWRTNSTWWHL